MEPKSVQVGTKKTDDWLLTHAEWWGDHAEDFGPSHETGIRPLIDGKAKPKSLQVIHHNWKSFDKAERFILWALDWGFWGDAEFWQVCNRIEEIMQALKDEDIV